MNLIARRFLFIILLSIVKTAFSQDSALPLLDEKKILFTKEFSSGLVITNRGFGINFKIGRQQTGYRKITYNGELAVIKHPQEVRQINPIISSNAKSFAFAKSNNFLTLRTGIGSDRLLFDRDEKDGVEIQLIYEAGLSTGLLKPIYYDVQNPFNNQEIDVIEEKFDPLKHDQSTIYGPTGFLRGLDETFIIPGAYIKSGINFDWSNQSEKIRSLEFGFTFDGYSKKIPIIATINNINVNKQYFLSLYAKISIGNRK